MRRRRIRWRRRSSPPFSLTLPLHQKNSSHPHLHNIHHNPSKHLPLSSTTITSHTLHLDQTLLHASPTAPPVVLPFPRLLLLVRHRHTHLRRCPSHSSSETMTTASSTSRSIRRTRFSARSFNLGYFSLVNTLGYNHHTYRQST